MLFTSASFIIFAAVLLLLYYLIPGKFQWILLLIGSIFFYACAGWKGLVFICITIVVSWLLVNAMGRSFEKQKAFLKSEEGKGLSREDKREYKKKNDRKRQWMMIIALVIDLGILATLKYTNFFLQTIGAAFGFEKTVEMVLPMGISFYTFQTVSYVIDVYWEKVEPEKSLLKTALFTSYFPLTIQGPITRFGDIKDDLFSAHKADLKNISFGIQRMLWGYFKKVVIADRLVAGVRTICSDNAAFGGAYTFAVIFLYAIQLYADFSGGIDITIGISEALGIHVKENFLRPFMSRNVAEFWRRWHISMGTWFKDYVVYPVSTSKWVLDLSKRLKRKNGKLIQGIGKRVPLYIATIITWFLTGLWHGATWNFVLWGLLNAVCLLVETEFKPVSQKIHDRFPKLTDSGIYIFFEMFRTFFIMSVLNMLDIYPSFGAAASAFGSIFTAGLWKEAFSGGLLQIGMSAVDFILVGIGAAIMIFVSVFQEKKGSLREALWKNKAASCTVFCLLFLIILVFGAYGVGYDASQFIYNQF